MDETEKLETIAKVTDRLTARYPGVPRPLIASVVADQYEMLDAGRIRTFIPTLVEAGARNRLRDLTTHTGDTLISRALGQSGAVGLRLSSESNRRDRARYIAWRAVVLTSGRISRTP